MNRITMVIRSFFCWLTMCCCAVNDAQGNDADLDSQFATFALPFLKTHCMECHNEQNAEAKLDLSSFRTSGDVAKGFGVWDHVLSRVDAREMPPKDATPQPTTEDRYSFVHWVRAFRRQEAMRNAGDPGVVLVRRLNNAEYNYSIRDLTGVDINPTRDFPVDPANEAGFDNSGESLTMSPALLNKYLDAARSVSEHLVLKPHGFTFAPHSVVTETDRDKYCVKRIVQFYAQQPTDYVEYFLAAWRLHKSGKSQLDEATFSQLCDQYKISPKYFRTVWSALTDLTESSGPLARLQTMWRALPNDLTQETIARDGCVAMRDFVASVRRKLEPKVDNLIVRGIHKGSQPFVLWKNDQYAKNRRLFSKDALIGELEAIKDASVASNEVTRTLIAPADDDQRSKYEADLARFCDVFPDAFFISERGRDYDGTPKEKQEKGRLLSAGFHSMMGYYRDDAPLCEMILSDAEKRELDELWRELDFVTTAPMRQYAGFVWFERTDSAFMRDAEFDFARAEDKSVTSNAMICKLAEMYSRKAKSNNATEIPLSAIQTYFEKVNQQIRWIEQARLAAEPSHLEALLNFASQAWRRDLSIDERIQIHHFYRSLRDSEGMTHEEAIQDSLVSVLMSPHFCYRVDYAVAGGERRALTDLELASRLSYFLWSSVPDKRLLQLTTAGELHRREALIAEVQRMLGDERARSLAIEFGGNWLDFRRFEEHNSVDRNRFPQFNDELRQAMFEEPIRFFSDIVQRNGSILEFLNANHTFVNSALAKHYCIPEAVTGPFKAAPSDWVRVDDARVFGRGGLIPMSVFLTKNAPGLRTSPVKRGYWVVRRLLGETIPPPPPNVPDLPSDESQLGERSLRDALAMHREHTACAACHNRFDSMGLVFENYGPTGERRDKDLGGRAVDTLATFPDNSQGEGIDGLLTYIKHRRQRDFVDNFCRKLTCFALGRSLKISDDPLIEQMISSLERNDYRFSILIDKIVTSSQFLEKRGETTQLTGQPLKP